MSVDATRRPLVVLVVDDTPETVSFLTSALDEKGLVVLVALSGARAIEIARKTLPDIVLMDAVMPEMDGFETCRQMKQDETLAHVPVIFMTGLNEPEHIVRAFAVGGADYVTKPVVVEEMLARIRVRRENAQRTHSAHLALDTTGRFLLAVDRNGTLLWATPQAQRLLEEVGSASEDHGRQVGVDLVRLRGGGTSDHPDAPGVAFAFLGELAPDEFLLRVSRRSDEPANGLESLRERFGLTQREAEILLWLTRGKSNRDIADICRLSPRTVDKHLETIFRKLGVENRTAAASLAIGGLPTS